jgi:hypothetical protein
METLPVKQGGFVDAECVLIFMVEIRRFAQIVDLITLEVVTESFA